MQFTTSSSFGPARNSIIGTGRFSGSFSRNQGVNILSLRSMSSTMVLRLETLDWESCSKFNLRREREKYCGDT